MRLLSDILTRSVGIMNKFFVYILSLMIFLSALGQKPTMNFTGDAVELNENFRMNLVNGMNQTGGAWYPQQFDLDSTFFLDVTFASAGLAEGWAIVLYQGDSMPIGPGVEQLGVPTIGTSFIAEFDFQQTGSLTDAMVPHVSFFENGSLSHLSVLQDNVLIPDLDANGESLRISWDPVTNEFSILRLGCTNSDISYSDDIKNTIFGGEPKVYVGFTASTSSLSDSVFIMQHYSSLGGSESQIVCSGESVVLNSYQGVPMQWVDVSNSDTLPHSHSSVLVPTSSGYFKRIQNGICDIEFTAYDSIYVEVVDTPVVSVLVVPEGNTNNAGVEVNITGGVSPITTEWLFPDSSMVLSEDLISVPSGVYTLTVQSGPGCETVRQVNVEPSSVTSQDYFSPNGDGQDEGVVITVVGESKIVNSAGQIIREVSEGYFWDGTDQYGALQPSGVYLVIGAGVTQIITLLR